MLLKKYGNNIRCWMQSSWNEWIQSGIRSLFNFSWTKSNPTEMLKNEENEKRKKNYWSLHVLTKSQKSKKKKHMIRLIRQNLQSVPLSVIVSNNINTKYYIRRLIYHNESKRRGRKKIKKKECISVWKECNNKKKKIRKKKLP